VAAFDVSTGGRLWVFGDRGAKQFDDRGRLRGVAEQPLKVELEQEADGRWLAEVIDLPGVLAYGATRDEALARAEALALRVIADRIEHGERAPELNNRPSALSRFVAKN
jgi:predicted RNase H-like HicB family nuclease